MKMSIFGMLVILLLLTVGPLVYFNGGVDYFDDFFSKSSKPKLNKDIVYAPVSTHEKVKVLKWKDENGIWQFGNAPPPGTRGVETMTLQPNMNIMQAIDVPGEAEEENTGSGLVRLNSNGLSSKYAKGKKGDKNKKDDVGMSQESLDNPYSPDSIGELFNSSQNIQKMLNNRHQQQSKGP